MEGNNSQELSREVIDEVLKELPESYRKVIQSKIFSVLENENLNNADKKNQIGEIIFKAKEELYYINKIKHTVKDIRNIVENDEFDNITSRNEIVEFLQSVYGQVDEVSGQMNIQVAKQLCTDSEKVLEYAKKNIKREIAGKKTSKSKLKPNSRKKQNLRNLARKFARKLAVPIAILGVGTPVAIDAAKTLSERWKIGELAASYESDETIQKVNKIELLRMYSVIAQNDNFTESEFNEFKNELSEMSYTIDEYLNEYEKIKNNNGGEEFIKLEQNVKDKMNPELLQQLIEAKIAVAYNTAISPKEQYNSKVSISNVELGTNNNGKNYIKISSDQHVLVNKEGMHLVGVLTGENTRMQGEFLDIVNVYQELNSENITAKEFSTYFKATLEFVAGREVRFDKNDFRIDIQSRQEGKKGKEDDNDER